MRIHLALAATLASVLPHAALSAQGSFDLDKVLDGRLGSLMGFSFANAPAGSTMLFMFSLTTGPTPLALADPLDPRSLALGLELAPMWFTTPTGPGSGSLGIPIPGSPALHGMVLNFQGVTAPGTSLLLGALSNPLTQQFALASTPTPLGTTLVQGRALTQAFRVGRDIMLAGGGQGSLLGATGLDSTERYDGRTMQVSSGPTMTSSRALAFSATLNDGRVFLCGGVDATGAVLSSAEIYDPTTNAWTATGSMAVARAAFDGTRLSDGRILVAGGTTTFVDVLSALAGSQATAEIYDPSSGTWSNVAAMPSRLLAPDLTLLNDGRVLLSGGFQVTVVFGIPVPTGSIAACRRYDPATNNWGAAATMNRSRGAHGLNTVSMLDGRVFVSGGMTSGPDLTQATAIADVEIYDPAANSWTLMAPLAGPSAIHAANVLVDGRIVVTGGATGTLTAPNELDTVQVFNPNSLLWTSLPNLPAPRAGHGAALTDDGILVLLGGQSGGGTSSLGSLLTIRP